MRRHLKIIILGGLLLIPAIPATAEVFEYVDNKGITHFTDNLSTIPPQFQSQIEQYAEIIPLHTGIKKGVARKTVYAPSVDVSSNITDEPAAKPAEIVKLAKKQKNLLDKKQALNKKFETLMAEKQALENRRQKIEGEKNIIVYNTQIQKINKKINQFKREEKQFLTALDQFNRSIGSRTR